MHQFQCVESAKAQNTDEYILRSTKHSPKIETRHLNKLVNHSLAISMYSFQAPISFILEMPILKTLLQLLEFNKILNSASTFVAVGTDSINNHPNIGNLREIIFCGNYSCTVSMFLLMQFWKTAVKTIKDTNKSLNSYTFQH